MDKTEKLLRMIEHPELYSDEQFQELFSDVECQQMYDAMRLSTSAFELVSGEAKVANDLKEKEWKKLETVIYPVKRQRGWMQIAAAILGILLLSGITYAAVWLFSSPSSPNGDEGQQIAISPQDTTALIRSDEVRDSIQNVRIFENVQLKVIVLEIGQKHHLSVEIKNSQTAALRLYYPWNQQTPLEQVIKELNQFEKVSITLKEDLIIIE
ncbi:MAG: hypothetical protein K6C10_11065 [Prevotella sp.]|nr:hypothetical protein [Prevotella sp.]